MDRNIQVSRLDRRAVEDQEVEIVERKGIGHPDSICDGIAESVSRALSQLYLDRVGKVLHYNTDETQLVAGRAAPAYGGGEVVEPLYVLIVGRATKEYEGEQLPVDSTALAAARDYLSEAIPELEYGTDVIVDVKLGEGSGDLQDVFGEETQQVPMANDTSFGVGHAPDGDGDHRPRGRARAQHDLLRRPPRTRAGREDHGQTRGRPDRHHGRGRDGRPVRRRARRVRRRCRERARVRHRPGRGAHGPGGPRRRQHRRRLRRGLRLPHRHRHLRGAGRRRLRGAWQPRERAHHSEPTHVDGGDLGKNPVNHIGKIYNLLSTRIAESVTDEVDGIRDLQIRLLSQIGRPIDEPHVADAQLVTEDGVALGDIEPEVLEIVDRELANVTDVTRSVIDGDVSTF